jgi:hypothetical protein
MKFFDWAYKSGGTMAAELDYVPLPESVVNQIRDLEEQRQGRFGQGAVLIPKSVRSRSPGSCPGVA